MTFSCIAFLLLLHSPWLLFLRVAIYRDTRVKWFFIKAPWDLHQQTRFPLSARCVWREAWCRTVIAALAGLMTLGELWKNDVKGVVWKVWPHLLPSAIFPDLLSSTAAHGVLCTENSGVKKLRVTESIWLHYTATNAWTVRLFLSVSFCAEESLGRLSHCSTGARHGLHKSRHTYSAAVPKYNIQSTEWHCWGILPTIT